LVGGTPLDVAVAMPVEVAAPVAEGGGVRVAVGGVSPGRSVRVGEGVGVADGKTTTPGPVALGVGVEDGVELGPPAAMREASTATNTVA
jgi:hypothetical protein